MLSPFWRSPSFCSCPCCPHRGHIKRLTGLPPPSAPNPSFFLQVGGNCACEACGGKRMWQQRHTILHQRGLRTHLQERQRREMVNDELPILRNGHLPDYIRSIVHCYVVSAELTCLHLSFFPFAPCAGHPSSSLFISTFLPFFPSRKVL